MNHLYHPFLLAAAAVLGTLFLLWLLSLKLRDVSIVDIFWSLGFVLAAWIYSMQSPSPSARSVLLLTLVTIWGLRLSIYLFWRNHGKGEDSRYREMRARRPGFAGQSLFIVFWLQGALILVIGLPHLFTLAQPTDGAWLWSDALGFAFWAIGFFFESVGDRQLARFKADPANRGKVMDRGLWRYTRHPNYFGDAMIWWGFFCFALAAPNGWWTFPCPVIMNFFLLKVSGVALLESTITERRPAYREYIERTSAFIPWPPRSSLKH